MPKKGFEKSSQKGKTRGSNAFDLAISDGLRVAANSSPFRGRGNVRSCGNAAKEERINRKHKRTLADRV